MSSPIQFEVHTLESAPAKSRPLMEGSKRKLGYLPDAVSRLAESPLVLGVIFQQFAMFESASLTPLEQEVVIMTVARANGCELCVAMHTARLVERGAPVDVLENLRIGTSLKDERLEALASFTRSLIQRTGEAGEEERQRFHAAGYSRSQALEVVLGIATYTLSTFANRLVGAQVDPALTAFVPAA